MFPSLRKWLKLHSPSRSHRPKRPPTFRPCLVELEPRCTPSITTLSFNGLNGSDPLAGLVRDDSGNLFGTTSNGGAFNEGAVFEVAAGTSQITLLASFNGSNGAHPLGSLVVGGTGLLFGTTRDGGNGSGTAFKVVYSDAVPNSGVITALETFDALGADGTNTSGASPTAGLVEDGSGNLFGTTVSGGAYKDGTVFELTAGNYAFIRLASFNAFSSNASGLIVDGSDNLFGTTEFGGTNNEGTVFRVVYTSGVTDSGAITSVASFDALAADGTNASGANPVGGVVEDGSGNLFGTANNGGTGGVGTVFEVKVGSGRVAGLASFDALAADGTNNTGANPQGGVLEDSRGNLFGTATQGGNLGLGTLFELAAGSNTITAPATFDDSNGATPFGNLVGDGSGDLFGTTSFGGANEKGTVFEFVPSTSQGNPTINTTPGGVVVLGSGNNLTDSATLSGGNSTMGGTITFYLFAPGVTPNATDSNNVYSDTVTVTANGTYDTSTGTNPGGYTPMAPGTYQWVASYSGDTNNSSVTSTLGNEPETVVGPGVTVVGNDLYIVGASRVQITPNGASTTGSTGVKVRATINGVTTTTTYSQAFSAIRCYGLNGNIAFQEASTLTINTYVTAGDGSDLVQLGGGVNSVTLGNGNDIVLGGGGNNTVTLGNGTDLVQLGNGSNNTLMLGGGNDIVLLGNGSNNTVTLGNGNEFVVLGNGNNNTLTLGNGNDVVVVGRGNHDTLTLGNGNDVVVFGGGNYDTLTLGNGNDIVLAGGGTGNDLDLGSGQDTVLAPGWN